MTALRLALRELRGGPKGLWLLTLCLFLGTAALAGIGSLSASIEAALDAQGRRALGGDLELRVSQRRATVEELAAMTALGRVSETVGMRAMADAGGTAALTDLRAVDARWPLVGRLAAAPGALLPRPGRDDVALAPALAERLGVRVGDRIRLGTRAFRIVGLIADEPDRLGQGFRLGPPAILRLDDLDATGLIQPGSLYEARYRIVLPPGRDPAAAGARFRDRFPSGGWNVRTAADATRSLRRGIAELGQFLALVGLAALAIACVGIAGGVAARLDARTAGIATLKVLGARATTIAAMLAIELGTAGVVGIGAGLALGAAVPAIVGGIAGDGLPVLPRIALYPRPLGIAAALALVAGAVSALPALARARAVPAATLLRGRLAGRRRPTMATLAAMAVLAGGGVALAVLTAADRRLAAGFVAAAFGLVGLLLAIGIALRFGVARLPRPRRPLLRLALANLHRPGAQTDRLVVALGLGFSLFVALAVVNGALSAEMRDAAPAKAPRFFAIDLQPADEPAFRAAVLHAAPGARIEAVPSLRGTVVALRGRRIAAMRHPPASWLLRGDRTLTWSAGLPPRNRIVAGRWWPPGYRGPPLVSIGDDAARSLGLHVGDTITIAVLGVEVPARIAALRAIDWGGLGLNFAIVFSPGYIEEAPHALLASVYAAPGADGAIARGVGAALPSVTLVRVGDVIAQIQDLVGEIGLAIRVAAAVTVVAGIVVLAGAIAASARARGADAVLLKLLGATRMQIAAAQAIEYALLSLLLAAVAGGVGIAAGWIVVRTVFDLAFVLDVGGVAATLALSAMTVIAVGTFGTLPILRLRPARALRDGAL